MHGPFLSPRPCRFQGNRPLPACPGFGKRPFSTKRRFPEKKRDSFVDFQALQEGSRQFLPADDEISPGANGL